MGTNYYWIDSDERADECNKDDPERHIGKRVGNMFQCVNCKQIVNSTKRCTNCCSELIRGACTFIFPKSSKMMHVEKLTSLQNCDDIVAQSENGQLLTGNQIYSIVFESCITLDTSSCDRFS